MSNILLTTVIHERTGLEDVSQRKARGKVKQRKSANCHFARFLAFAYPNEAYQDIREFPPDHDFAEMLGIFSDFLDKYCPSINKKSTHKQ